MAEDLLAFAEHRTLIAGLHHLWEITDTYVFWATNYPFGRRINASEELKQSRFTCSIFTHESNALLSGDDEGNILKEGLCPKVHGDVIDANHRLE